MLDSPVDIIKFERKVIEAFKNKEILAPVHLDDGNEDSLFHIFRDFRIGKNDWICCTWRSHAKCLLKGVPGEDLMRAIKNGKSIALNFKEHKVVSSAIVGGNIPIAVGLAMSLVERRENGSVFCFVGDMTAESGIFEEAVKYSVNHKLPLFFVVENNKKSVCTPTVDVWNKNNDVPSILLNSTNDEFTKSSPHYSYCSKNKIIYYKYTSQYPHSGVGERITF